MVMLVQQMAAFKNNQGFCAFRIYPTGRNLADKSYSESGSSVMQKAGLRTPENPGDELTILDYSAVYILDLDQCFSTPAKL